MKSIPRQQDAHNTSCDANGVWQRKHTGGNIKSAP
jgi:hypothetical protein